MIFKIIIVALLVFIVVNLFLALPQFLKADPEVKMSRFLGRRLLFSVLVMVLILIAMGLGFITPNPSP